jgi:hypothetical protein
LGCLVDHAGGRLGVLVTAGRGESQLALHARDHLGGAHVWVLVTTCSVGDECLGVCSLDVVDESSARVVGSVCDHFDLLGLALLLLELAFCTCAGEGWRSGDGDPGGDLAAGHGREVLGLVHDELADDELVAVLLHVDLVAGLVGGLAGVLGQVLQDDVRVDEVDGLFWRGAVGVGDDFLLELGLGHDKREPPVALGAELADEAQVLNDLGELWVSDLDPVV